MRSLQTRDIEVAHLRAGQAMTELEAEHKAQQQGVTRWREAKEFANLLELADAVYIQTAAENYRAIGRKPRSLGTTSIRTPKHSLKP